MSGAENASGLELSTFPDALMRYIRFLKTPRVVTVKGSSKKEISCLITITSDLGDSFLPHDVELSAELLSRSQAEEVAIWRTIQWTAGMRSLPITFPLVKLQRQEKLLVRVGAEPKASTDEYGKLLEEGTCGVVSAWSQTFDLAAPIGGAEKLVERRFKLSNGHYVRVLEETGESIARHLWDAGITLSCHIGDLLDENSQLANALLPSGMPEQSRVLELGTGCGMVGITIAGLTAKATVVLTDLPEAQEIVERNIAQHPLNNYSKLEFRELDWDAELPQDLQESDTGFDLIVAADCTYNSDSSPALVQTLCRLARVSPEVRIAIAMKMRHSSEDVFFDLMSAAGFHETTKLEYPLPGDVEIGEETVNLHVYQYKPSA